MENTPPAIVMEFAKSVGLVPMKWHLYPEEVVIIFEQGQKMHFKREPSLQKPEGVQHTTSTSSSPTKTPTRRPRKIPVT
jgi:hypothetical protein